MPLMRSMLFVAALTTSSASAARLSLALGGAGASAGLPPDMLRLDIVWTMGYLDSTAQRLTGLDLRFDVEYPPGGGRFDVVGVSSLPDWDTSPTLGITLPFDGGFFLAAGHPPGVSGIVGNGTEFSTVAASVLLRSVGNVEGTEIVFRHDSNQDPLPAAYQGPFDWTLLWQFFHGGPGPGRFDIGVGNPGDARPPWIYNGHETYQPLVIPEPGSLALLILAALAQWPVTRRFR